MVVVVAEFPNAVPTVSGEYALQCAGKFYYE